MVDQESASSPPSSVQVKDHIALTKNEEEIFECLCKVVERFNLGTVIRVAGGWVRDKLLGIPSNDIDIALDNMHGLEFCNKVNEYLSEIKQENLDVCFIPCNPEQSKHLETARMCWRKDVWIDVVNLRSEEYSDNSRIPSMNFGTPKVDAERRDLTINSMFYNIKTKLIEDFTGRGIADLKAQKIVTPLPPMRTFLDDPLRVLRAIRFGARFGFALDEELKKAASDKEVKDAIENKISRERIGHEIDLMLYNDEWRRYINGNQPVKAMASITDLGLFWTVFRRPSVCKPPIPEGRESSCVDCLDSAWRLLNLIGCSSFSKDQKRLYLFAAIFLPLSETIYTGNKEKKIPVVDYIIRDSLKLKKSDAETVIRLHTATKKFVTLIPSLVSKEDIQVLDVDWKRDIIDVPITSKLRILTGLVLREIKEFWRVALLLSMLLHPVDILESSTCFSNEKDEVEKSSGLLKTVENAIAKQGLEKVWEMKPLVNGKEIILEIKSGGPDIGEWQHKLLQWQLAYPSGTADECLDWMKANLVQTSKNY